jgi:hypothetical protein
MKNDATTTILNFVLATMVIICVVFGWLASKRAAEVHALQIAQNQNSLQEVKVQSLVNDVITFNQQYKSPELTRMLQILLTKPAAPKQP